MDLQALEPLLRTALAEDVGTGDVTTRLLVPVDAAGRGVIMAKQGGVLAGIDVALAVLRLAGGEEPRILERASEGAAVEPGDLVVDLEGSAQALLSGERTALNFLMRLSGIASLTAKYVEAVRGTEARILDTRKTTPGLRVLEKHAVRTGGGENHRFALYDAILVKENHLAFGGSLAAAMASRPAGMPAIVEAESVEEFRLAMEAGADVAL
ncbi:MAG: carboxylating nicotinate-nucleotide diphosphorylase, partial [Planctomycetota bacterium]